MLWGLERLAQGEEQQSEVRNLPGTSTWHRQSYSEPSAGIILEAALPKPLAPGEAEHCRGFRCWVQHRIL